ncbi:glucose-1-phosphate cytidylyltransferase [Pseudomonadales bacterium]|nr:glucose-1-phosphate cytidylyltransferase [Pseudomonadales bacterium]
MKVILLAGGFGTRLSEYTDVVPKPMVTIGGKPILWHIMQAYAKFNHKDFYVALGYKAEVIREFFYHYHAINTDFVIDMSNGSFQRLGAERLDWRVTLVDTGLNSMTGGRVKRMQSFIGNETCMLTYGDGVANIDLDKLLAFHRSHGKMITVSAVRPAARFGELEIEGSQVVSFKEKPQLDEGWINGGYFVIEPEFFDLIEGDKTLLEREPLEAAAAAGELMAYHHFDFWHCMDSKRDKDALEEDWVNGASWLKY